MATKSREKVGTIICCNLCDYTTSRKDNYNKHILTSKHLNKVNGNTLATESREKVGDFVCSNCSKHYRDRTGLWKHKKKCDGHSLHIHESSHTNHDLSYNDVKALSNLVLDVVKQNQELAKQIMELSKNNIITNNNCNNTNTINNKFNLQVFLNEKCKDALNINEFVDSLKISFKDFENVGSLGFVEGISKIFLKGLKQLDITKRPIHCSDLKRETMYVKDKDTWEKDSEDKNKIKMAIKNIAHKNTRIIPFWRDANPTCQDSQSKKNDQYMKILYESMGPCDHEEDNANYEKIIKKIAKEVTIDKN
jgi:hypothetical protein